MENTEYNPFEDFEMEPNQIVQAYQNNTSKEENPFVELAAKESWGKSILRYMAQIPKGKAQVTTYGIITNLINMLAYGEAMNPADIEDLKRISEREGIPFDEEAYLEAVQQAEQTFPTVGNIANKIEDITGIPLEAKTRGQQFVEFASSAGKLSPKTPTTFRGMNTALPRPVLGTGVAATAEVAKELGVPEPIADIGSFAILKQLPVGSPSLEIGIGKETKPSGLTTRQFEKIKEPKEVSEGKFQQINRKLESEFKEISDKIISDSPIGETAKNLKNDPTFKQASRELLGEAQTIANEIAEPMASNIVKNEIDNIATKKVKGFALNEYDKNYLKYMKEAKKDILSENISAGELVEQYRKNNKSLGEYFEPGSSKALNRAKRDALLDQNRAIASAMEKAYPESELVPVFKDGNARWTKIMDAEAVDEFVTDVFKNKGINYKELHNFFDKEGYGHIFERSLGKEGLKEFEQLLKDTLTTEAPYKMLKVAQKKGYDSLFRTGLAYVLHPTIGSVKAGIDVTKFAYKTLINSMLDKPQIAFTFRRGVQNLKKGNFKAADRDFKTLKGEIEILPKEAETAPKNTKSAAAEKEIDITPVKEAKKTNSNIDEAISVLEENHPESQNLKDLKEIKGEKKSSPEPKKQIEYTEPKMELPATPTKAKNLEPESKPKPATKSSTTKPTLTPEQKKLKDLKKKQKQVINDFSKAENENISAKLEKESERLNREIYEAEKKVKASTKLPEEKIKEIKHQDISKAGLKSQKQFLLDRLDEAIKDTKTEGHHQSTSPSVRLQVPGDGEFKINNNSQSLESFRKEVEKNWPDKPYKPRGDSAKKPFDKYPEHAFKDHEIAHKARLEKELEESRRPETKTPPINKTKLSALEESYKTLDKQIDRNIAQIERLYERYDSDIIMNLRERNKQLEKQKDKIKDKISKIKYPKTEKQKQETRQANAEKSLETLKRKKYTLEEKIRKNRYSSAGYEAENELKEVNRKIEKLESKLKR